MATDVTAQMVVNDVRGMKYTYNVREYAEYILNHESEYPESLTALVKSMLNYGTAAQQYFSWQTDRLANESLSEQDKALPDVDYSGYRYQIEWEEHAVGIQYYGSALSLKADTYIKDYFTIEDGYTIDDFTFLVTTADGEQVTLQPRKTRMNGKICYYIVIGDIQAYELDRDVVVTVQNKNASDQEAWKLHYGVFSYADIVSGRTNVDEKLVTVMKALHQYWKDAKTYKTEQYGE